LFVAHGLECWLRAGRQTSKRSDQARRTPSPDHLTQHLSLFMFAVGVTHRYLKDVTDRRGPRPPPRPL
jgi:hypothetical protein